jgi:uncharacterized protein YciI
MNSLFIVLLRYLVPLEQILEIRPSHLEFLDRYYEKGIFMVSGPQIPRSGGVIIAQIKDRSDLEDVLKEDPFYQKGFAEYQIFQFEATKASDAWQSIFPLQQ